MLCKTTSIDTKEKLRNGHGFEEVNHRSNGFLSPYKLPLGVYFNEGGAPGQFAEDEASVIFISLRC